MDKFCYEHIAMAVNEIREIKRIFERKEEKENREIDWIIVSDDTTALSIYVRKDDCIFRSEYFGDKKQFAVINKYTGDRIGYVTTTTHHLFFPQFVKE